MKDEPVLTHLPTPFFHANGYKLATNEVRIYQQIPTRLFNAVAAPAAIRLRQRFDKWSK